MLGPLVYPISSSVRVALRLAFKEPGAHPGREHELIMSRITQGPRLPKGPGHTAKQTRSQW